jgi:hypothetical protein
MSTEMMSQQRLALEIRRLTDESMIVRPLHGPNRAAMARLRALLTAYPHALRSSHITHNLGRRRMEWLTEVQRRWT